MKIQKKKNQLLLTNIFHLAFHIWAHTEKNKDNEKVDLVNVSISAERVQQPEVSMGSAGCKVHYSAVLVAGELIVISRPAGGRNPQRVNWHPWQRKS